MTIERWTNIGDVSPMQGAFLIRNAEIDPAGDFLCEAVETISETDIGGDEKRIGVTQGMLFCSKACLEKALETMGGSIHDGYVLLDDGTKHALGSEAGMITLAHAARGFNGVEPDIRLALQFGKDEPYDQPLKFTEEWTDELIVLPSNAKPWNALRRYLDGFDYVPPARVVEEEPAEAPSL